MRIYDVVVPEWPGCGQGDLSLKLAAMVAVDMAKDCQARARVTCSDWPIGSFVEVHPGDDRDMVDAKIGQFERDNGQ